MEILFHVLLPLKGVSNKKEVRYCPCVKRVGMGVLRDWCDGMCFSPLIRALQLPTILTQRLRALRQTILEDESLVSRADPMVSSELTLSSSPDLPTSCGCAHPLELSSFLLLDRIK